MDEEYDVIVLGTGLTVRFRVLSPNTLTKQRVIKLFCTALRPLFMHPEVKALHIPVCLCHYMDAIIINARD